MPLQEMENLLHALSLSKNNSVVSKNQNHLQELPLAGWLIEIEKLRDGATVMNVDSLLEYIEKFKQFYNEDDILVQDPRE